MANKTWKSQQLWIDNAAGTLTNISSWVNSVSIQGVQAILDDTSLADSESSALPGLAGATVPIAGFVNSTTEGIFGPLVGNHFTTSKTLSFYNSLQTLTGEVYLSEVQFSGSVGDLLTFSANATFDGTVTRTSVAPS